MKLEVDGLKLSLTSTPAEALMEERSRARASRTKLVFRCTHGWLSFLRAKAGRENNCGSLFEGV